jgi:hypothetical protein
MKGGLIFTLIVFICISGFTQTASSGIVETKKFSYSFTGDAAQPVLDQVQSHLYQIKGIAEVKTVYKADSKSGVVYFFYSAYVDAGEQDTSLNMAEVKGILIEAGLIPDEFKEL